ncbi:MAG: hypothetical protein AAF959_18665 [Cyanobacteria bacterium P01_D01_bin.56]
MNLEREVIARQVITETMAAYPFPGFAQLAKDEVDRIEKYKVNIANSIDIKVGSSRWSFFEKLFRATYQAVPLSALETGCYLQDYAKANGEDVLNHMWRLVDPEGDVERSERGLNFLLANSGPVNS